MELKLVLQNIIDWVVNLDNTYIIQILTNIITSIGVVFGFIFSIVTLRQSKQAQIE
ncbi:hypothetical protein I5976_09470 [Clostridioides difficile]|uniref:hypothetical protein n=1 Tax=Clostridioides difficile TaxID=1496 RepID=UPI001304BBD4|nr:hypothetical protein [Clostridioides difficile]MBH7042676.1 hypothetical protein [Clostridioides difficile]MBH7450058.1 hypothetical protein [Clostridioides difficile]MBH7487563.1 hypothetical protein [Clostridioides difficile]MBH8116616.1 hypothetical protein [Clostridioides difficile]MBY1363243.1 hypothetical protein [Clostridioides difficile]